MLASLKCEREIHALKALDREITFYLVAIIKFITQMCLLLHVGLYSCVARVSALDRVTGII